jgi:DNA-binding NarL/FixJ family response regulator
MDKIRLLIVDDHKIFRDGVRALLNEDPEIDVTAEANDGAEALEIAKKQNFDVVLMDIRMPGMNGIEATALLKGNFPDIRILALSMYDEDHHIMEMLQAGARGYVLKNTGKKELITAIKTLAAGDSYFSKEVSTKIFEHLGSGRKDRVRKKGTNLIPLTRRELEILKLIAEELTNQEIADQLFISIRTVDTHRRNLLQKLNVKNTAGLVRHAYQVGLLE